MHGGFGGNGGDGCLSLLGVGGCVNPSWFSWIKFEVARLVDSRVAQWWSVL